MDFTFLRSRRVFAALEGYPDRPSIKTVERWCAGTAHPPQWAEAVIAERLGITGQQESAPAWAEALANKTAMKVIEALVDPEVLAALPDAIAALEAPPQPANGSAHASGGSPDQVLRPRRDREAG